MEPFDQLKLTNTNANRHPPPQVKMAQAPLPQGGDHAALQQDQWLRQEALQVGGGVGVWGSDVFISVLTLLSPLLHFQSSFVS